MFERRPEHPGPEYNEIMAVKLRREAEAKAKLVAQETWPEPPSDPLARVRAEHPDLFPKTPQGKQLLRATVRNRNEIPEETVVRMVFRALGL